MTHIRFRRGTAETWRIKNPILEDGEPAWESDGDDTENGKMKIGNGVTHYNDLPYVGEAPDNAATRADLNDHINSETPHPVYDDGPSFQLIYQNAKV